LTLIRWQLTGEWKGAEIKGIFPFLRILQRNIFDFKFPSAAYCFNLGRKHLFQLTTCQASVEKLITAKRKRVLWLIAFFKCGQVLQLFIAQAKDKPQFNDE